MRNIIVIAGGWSVSQYPETADLTKYGHVIAVNESAVLKANHVGVTMDRLWAEHRAHRYFMENDGELWVRKAASKNLPQHQRLIQFDCDHEETEMSQEVHTLNGTNSGMCALNLAYHCQPERLFLFGFDMQRGPNGEPYYHQPYEWANPAGATSTGKYKEWAPQFDAVARAFARMGTQVFNINPRSKLKCFVPGDFVDFLRWVK